MGRADKHGGDAEWVDMSVSRKASDPRHERVPVIMQVRSGAPITRLSGAGCGGRAQCRPSVSITVCDLASLKLAFSPGRVGN